MVRHAKGQETFLLSIDGWEVMQRLEGSSGRAMAATIFTSAACLVAGAPGRRMLLTGPHLGVLPTICQTSWYTSQRYLFEDRVPWRAEVMASCVIDAIPRAHKMFGGVYRGQSEKAVALQMVARSGLSFYTRSSLVVG